MEVSLPSFCPSSWFDATRSDHLSTAESLANPQPKWGIAGQMMRGTFSGWAPRRAFLQAFLEPEASQPGSTALELVFLELSVDEASLSHAHGFVFWIKTAKGIPIKGETRILLPESKIG